MNFCTVQVRMLEFLNHLLKASERKLVLFVGSCFGFFLRSVLSWEGSSANFCAAHPIAISSSVGLLLSSGCLKFTSVEYYF